MYIARVTFCMCLLILILAVSQSQAALKTFQEGKGNSYSGNTDTWTNEEKPDTPEGWDRIHLEIRWKSYGKTFAFLKWDIEGEFDASNTVVDSAFVLLRPDGSTIDTTWAHRLLKSWDERTCTWNSRSTGNAWGTPGVGLDNVDAEATAFDNCPYLNEYKQGDTQHTSKCDTASYRLNMTAIVQDWIMNPGSNHGFILVHYPTDDGLVSDRVKIMCSDNTGHPKYMPKLVVYYHQGIVSSMDHHTGILVENTMTVCAPNPAHGPVHFTIRGANPGADLTITDMTGRLVFRAGLDAEQLVWDGRDNRGHKVAMGQYVIHVRSKGNRISRIISMGR